MQYALGVTVALDYYPFFLGISADYNFVNQLSEVKSPYGNRRGVRTNVLSPTIGMLLLGWTLKMDYQHMGTYTLEKNTLAGDELRYENPKGIRLFIGSLFGFVPFGGQFGLVYETIEYAKEVVGGNDQSLSDKMIVKQVGFMLNFPFSIGGGI